MNDSDISRLTSTQDPSAGAFIAGARAYLGVLIIFGCLGNLACLVVYHRSRLLRRFRSTAFLKALAISDLSFLLCLGLVWLKGIDVHWQDYPVVCPLSIYVSNTSSFLSAWYVMAMTAEMACTVRRAKFRMGTRGAMRLIIAASGGGGKRKFSTPTRLSAIAAFALVMNGWTLAVTESETIELDSEDWSSGLDNSNGSSSIPWAYNCRIALDSENVYKTFNILDTVFSFTIPLAVTVLLNFYIAYVIVTAARYRSQPPLFVDQQQPQQQGCDRPGAKTSLSTTTVTSIPGGNGSSLIFSTSKVLRHRVAWRPSRKETAMASLLAARSLAYIALNMPNYVHRLMAAWESSKSSTPSSTTASPSTDHDGSADLNAAQSEAVWQILAYMFFYTQFALNFVIYSGRVCLRAAMKRKMAAPRR